ncbi:MAG: FAD-dependent monooxygenase [Hyphomicrobiaceae bacterium]
MPHHRPGPILIAGGGIGGLSAALALARSGWHCIVAERRADWSEAGAGIQLSPNGARILERLGVAHRLAPSVAAPREIRVREARSGAILQRLPLGDWIADRHGAPFWQVHRRDLQSALVEAATAEPRIEVRLGFEAVAFEDDGRRARLVGRDGRALEGSALIAADGVFSLLRRQLLATPAPRFSGWTAARTIVPLPIASDSDGLIAPDATGVWLAPDAHVVHYPVRAGREMAFVVVRTEPWQEQGWSAPVPSGIVEAQLRRVAPRLAAALGGEHDWRRWALFELEPLPSLAKGRVALLGDAAHPTLPFLAQGGVLALEDAATLASSLDRIDTAPDIPTALAAYSGKRLPRSRRVVAAARRNGTVFHLGGIAGLARNAAMRALGGERIMTGYDWLYGWRPE